jgi:hypothetical protein
VRKSRTIMVAVQAAQGPRNMRAGPMGPPGPEVPGPDRGGAAAGAAQSRDGLGGPPIFHLAVSGG